MVVYLNLNVKEQQLPLNNVSAHVSEDTESLHAIRLQFLWVYLRRIFPFKSTARARHALAVIIINLLAFSHD